MKWTQLQPILKNSPLFETDLLLAGNTTYAEVTRQLSRWKSSGKVVQLRKGVYLLAHPTLSLHPFQVANRLVHPSYISLQSALAYYQLIPEYVPVTTSLTTARPGTWDTPVGRFEYHFIQVNRFQGYRWLNIGAGQSAFMAWPEKALLDLIHLRVSGDTPGYLESLRLQNTDQLSFERLTQFAVTPKLKRAVRYIQELMHRESVEYETL